MSKSKSVIQVATAADIDQLGAVKAQIAELEKIEAALVAKVKAAGLGRIEGQLFEANTFEQDRESVNWKAIAEKVGFSPQLKAAHTSRSTSVVTKVQARTGIAAKAA